MATCESACCRPNLISSHVPSRPSSQQMYRRKDIYLSVICHLYDSNDVMLSRRQRMNGSTSWNRKSFSSRPQVRLQLRFHKKVSHTFVLFIRSRLAERRRKTELPSSRRPDHDMATLSVRPLLEDVSGRASCMRAISDKMAVASPWFFEASQTAARLSQSFEDTRCFLGNLTPLVIASVLTLRVLQNGAQSTRQGIANRSAAMQQPSPHIKCTKTRATSVDPTRTACSNTGGTSSSSRESPRHSELVPHAQSSVQVTRPFA